MPVPLFQRVRNQRLILSLNPDPQQHVGSHEQRVRPALLGKIVAIRDRVLQNAVAKPQSLVLKIINLGIQIFLIFFVTCRLI